MDVALFIPCYVDQLYPCAAAPPYAPRETSLDNMVGLAFTQTWVTPPTA
jgi:hypothetical protein